MRDNTGIRAASVAAPLASAAVQRRIGSPFEFGIPQIYSRTSDRFREGFRMPARRERSTQVRGRASESPRRTNPRDGGERLAYGDFAWQRLWRGMVFPRSARGESR